MKAIVKNERAVGLVMKDVPEPPVGPGWVKIRPLFTAICGTDIHIYKWDAWASQVMSPPITIGHEFVGTIAELGPGVEGLEIGQRVVGEGHFTCGSCRNCREGRRHLCAKTEGLGVQRPGCFAEFFCLPAENVFPIPESIPDEVAAIFDPLGNAVHTALAFNLTGEDVLITGAGPIGLMATKIAKHVGARTVTVTDISPKRLDLALRLGATTALNVGAVSLPEVIAGLGVDDGFGVGLEMSGHQMALAGMLRTMRPGGTIALLGILPNDAQVDWSEVIFRSLTLKGIYGREIFGTWYKMLHLLESGLDVSDVITHRYSWGRWEDAFHLMMSGECGKVLIDWRS